MATIGAPTNDAADLLKNLSLDAQPKTLEVHDAPKFRSIASANGFSSMAKPYERSTTPIQDYANLNMYYPHSGYPYYYGGYEDHLWNDYRYLNHDGVDMHSGMQQQRATSGMGQATGFVGRSHVNDQMYSQFGSAYRGGSGFSLNYYNPKSNWQAWRASDNKFTPKGRNNGFFNYGFENKDTLNELSKGPRAKDVKNQPGFVSAVKLAVKGQDLTSKANNKEENVISVTPDKEQYNKEDFPESYADAKFFIIKSYSEDDVHKSVKYNVWASTPNGNKKLDAAYQEAQAKPERSPVFLLFSVNASGQFVGLAEMVGPVDFNKSMDFWQQDKWTGCFPVKWHIVKDVPNSLLKHITLEYNDNKPVTNSRDTQEVKLEQAIQVVKIFKSHLSKTSILDDFEFYESRQRTLQEKKTRRQQYHKQGKSEKGSEGDKLWKDVAAAMIEESPNAVPISHPNIPAKPSHESAARVTVDGAKSGKDGGADETASLVN